MKIFKLKYLLQAWWLFVIMIAIAASPKIAYATSSEITMGSGGNLIFSPNELTISVGDTVKFVNGELPPHNMVVKDHPELSHTDLSFLGGESFEVTFPESGDYEFQCDPHAGAGMTGIIHVQ
tara:strand:+ start:203 stop:568 length:366 start_codon:yes stop_codon:yes gene_type:complete